MSDITRSFIEHVLTGPKSGFFIRLYESMMMSGEYTESKTRLQHASRTRSCRNWQQYTALLYSFFEQNQKGLLTLEQINRKGINGSRALYDHIFQKLAEMKYRFDYQKHSPLYQLLETTTFEPCMEKKENTVCPVLLEEEDQLQIGPNYMGVCSDNHNVLHYFTIYKYMNQETPIYYLSSSYGSDFISTPARTIPLEDYSEFSSFLNALQRHESSSSKKIIKSFYEKYFFKRKEGINLNPYFHYTNDQFKELQEFYPAYVEKHWLTSKPLSKSMAQQLELNVSLYQNIRQTVAKPDVLNVYLFDGYQEELNFHVRGEVSVHGGKFKRAVKRTKKNKMKRTHTRHVNRM